MNITIPNSSVTYSEISPIQRYEFRADGIGWASAHGQFGSFEKVGNLIYWANGEITDTEKNGPVLTHHIPGDVSGILNPEHFSKWTNEKRNQVRAEFQADKKRRDDEKKQEQQKAKRAEKRRAALLKSAKNKLTRSEFAAVIEEGFRNAEF